MITRGFNVLARKLTSPEAPPMMFSPISSALPVGETQTTPLAPMALSTTLPATSASMVTARSMQSAQPLPVGANS